jgi:hypothetical protein
MPRKIGFINVRCCGPEILLFRSSHERRQILQNKLESRHISLVDCTSALFHRSLFGASRPSDFKQEKQKNSANSQFEPFLDKMLRGKDDPRAKDKWRPKYDSQQ